MSKELESLEEIGNIDLGDNPYKTFDYMKLKNVYNEEFNAIKQALLKTHEKSDKEAAFDLINEKDVDIKLLKWAYPSVEAYNTKVRTEKDYWWRKELTGEEFEFLGRMVGAI